MNQRIVQLSLVLNDYDEAIAFYTEKLGFELVEDTRMSETKKMGYCEAEGRGRL